MKHLFLTTFFAASVCMTMAQTVQTDSSYSQTRVDSSDKSFGNAGNSRITTGNASMSTSKSNAPDSTRMTKMEASKTTKEKHNQSKDGRRSTATTKTKETYKAKDGDK